MPIGGDSRFVKRGKCQVRRFCPEAAGSIPPRYRKALETEALLIIVHHRPASCYRIWLPPAATNLGRMVKGFARRLGVATGAGTGLFIVTWGGWRFAQLAGLAIRGEQHSGDAPDLRELAATGAVAGVITGGGYALVRPVLPRQPELAGLVYALASGLALRLPVNAIAELVGRERRTVTRSDLVPSAVLGLALAETERLFR